VRALTAHVTIIVLSFRRQFPVQGENVPPHPCLWIGMYFYAGCEGLGQRACIVG